MSASDGPAVQAAPARRRARVLALGIGILASLLLLELGCQAFARMRVFPFLDALRASPRHYYRPAESPGLAYELAPGKVIRYPDRWLRINRWGIRHPDDDRAEGAWRIALLGDSVVFGIGHSQERTLSALLQGELDATGRRIRIFNFGLPGLNLAELVEQLRLKDALYDVHEVVYLLNPNDLARRESIYEGADNGLYRAYRRPRIASLFLARKAVYRWMKNGSADRWYRWFWRGNEEWAQEQLRALAAYAGNAGAQLRVVLLPSGRSYTPDGYRLADVHRGLAELLREEGIAYLDPTELLAMQRARYFDATDHLHDAGNAKLARILRTFLQGQGVDRAVRPAAGASATP